MVNTNICLTCCLKQLHCFDFAAALHNSTDLAILPRIMAFVSTTLYEMSGIFSCLRSGPCLNANWLWAYGLIEVSGLQSGSNLFRTESNHHPNVKINGDSIRLGSKKLRFVKYPYTLCRSLVVFNEKILFFFCFKGRQYSRGIGRIEKATRILA
jgi:hypothetical protein